MPSLLDDFRNNPTGSLRDHSLRAVVLPRQGLPRRRCRARGRPILWPGMNAAFEDCVVLDECLEEFPRTASAHSPNTFVAEKKTPMRLPILRSGISSRCETRPRRKRFARKRNWITRWKPPCPEYICRFTQWSLSQECHTQRQRSGRRSRTVLVYASLFVIAAISGCSDALVSRNLRQALNCERNFRCRKSARPIILAACI